MNICIFYFPLRPTKISMTTVVSVTHKLTQLQLLGPCQRKALSPSNKIRQGVLWVRFDNGKTCRLIKGIQTEL